MTRLESLIARRDRAEEKAAKARAEYYDADCAVHDWASGQVKRALARKGITPGKSVVRMKVRLTRNDRIFLEETECLFDGVGRVTPPTMERGALGPNACSTDMWWSAQFWWRNIRKDGTAGAHRDRRAVSGDSVAELAAQIHHVRDIE